MERWQDRVAVVTGASEGIGAAIVRRLAASGMRVVALARRQQLLAELEQSVRESGAKGSVKGYICDVSSRADVTAAFKSIDMDFGPVSVLVNNAGVLKPVNYLDLDLDDFQALLDVNLVGVINCVKAGLESMKIHNVNDGHIINISSIAGHRLPAQPEYAAYSATKHALNVLTKSIKMQLLKQESGIRVSSISPGLVHTSMTRGGIDKLSLTHYIEPENIADGVAYVIGVPKNVNVSEMIIEPV